MHMTTTATGAARSDEGVSKGRRAKRGFFRDNSLSLVCFALFLVFAAGQAVTGYRELSSEQQEHGEPTSSFGAYLTDGHFWEALTENWESEFLQMSAYVLLTVFLIQRGSAESKDPDKHEEVDEEPSDAQRDPDAPWPVRRGGLWLKLYENSLLIAFFSLTLLSMFLHALSGAHKFSAEQMAHGQPAVSTIEYVRTSNFWFESFQNWQSEFLAVFAIVVFTVFLRQRGSPESKPVEAPRSATNV
jgi:hypothetical protein